ncbi:MAG: EAL domain-containing protein [Parahaliea sp.]
MSLHKQLWLAIILLLLLVCGGGIVVNSLSTRAYLEQALYMKNVDNANALALSLTQQDADPVLLELTISAQFDAGHYELIELKDTEGNTIIRRENREPIAEAPAWFTALLPIKVEPGSANIQNGWQQVGTLTLRSHSRLAYHELWQSSKLLVLIFVAALLCSGLLGSYLLRRILNPLNDVVTQAEAIGNRRFITIAQPATLEFRKVVAAMNTLSTRMQRLLKEEAARLEKWKHETHIDKITGLTNREPFMKTLAGALESDNANGSGLMVLLRVSGLAQLNQVYGRKTVDNQLREIGNALNSVVASHSRWSSSRLNGSDFALLAPRAMEPGVIAAEVQRAVHNVLADNDVNNVELPVAATLDLHGESVTELMTRLDAALLTAEKARDSSINIAHRGDVQVLPMREQILRWQSVFDEAFDQGRFSLASFPVVDRDGKLIHYESPVRLEREGKILVAGTFLPWVNRLDKSLDLDRHVIEMALQQIAVHNKPLCVKLSVAAVVEPGFPAWLSHRLASNAAAARRLWIGIPEATAFRHLDHFKLITERARLHGCKVAIEHMGHQLAGIGKLHDVGLDQLKVDVVFVRDIQSNPANQTLLRILCTLGHSIGIKVIAEGVRSEAEQATLMELGIDGITGPVVRTTATSSRVVENPGVVSLRPEG